MPDMLLSPFERIYPQSLDMEQAVLGAMLTDRGAVEVACEMLRPADFYRDAHNVIFTACRDLLMRREAVDYLTVQEELKHRDFLENIGGGPYLKQLMDSVASSANVEHYAKIVSDRAILRGLIDAGRQMEALAHSEYADIGEVTNKAQQIVMAATQSRLQSRDALLPMAEELDEIIAEAERMAQSGNHVCGLSTGWGDLDYVTAGWQQGELVIIGARTGMGKSAFALQAALHVTRNYGPVAYFNLEMGRKDFGRRLLAMDSGVPTSRLRSGYLHQSEQRALARSRPLLKEKPVYIDQSTDVTTLEMRNRLRRLKREKGLAMVVVDYVQLVPPVDRKQDRYLQVGETSRDLHRIAKEFEVPVLALCQLNRVAVGQRPELHHLRESGNLEHDARLVIFLWQPGAKETKKVDAEDQGAEGAYEKVEAEFYIAKQNNGQANVGIDVHFTPALTRFDLKSDDPFAPEPWEGSLPYKDA